MFALARTNSEHTPIIMSKIIMSEENAYRLLMRFKNSSLVLGSSLKTPSMHEVVVVALIF